MVKVLRKRVRLREEGNHRMKIVQRELNFVFDVNQE